MGYLNCTKILLIWFSATGRMQAAPAYPDTLIKPLPDRVFTGVPVKLSVPDTLQGRAVGRVAFLVRYMRYASNKMPGALVHRIVAVDSAAPFETLWDYADVPDQDNQNLRFHYIIVADNGDTIDDAYTGMDSRPEHHYRDGVLDRHAGFSEKRWECPFVSGPVRIDGKTDEWDWSRSVRFVNNDNRIRAASRWDTEGLYFVVGVKDAGHAGSAGRADTPAYLQDDLELFLDLTGRRSMVRGARVFQIIFTPERKVRVIQFPSTAEVRRGAPDCESVPVRFVISITDSGYRLEAALAWQDLGITPAAGRILGINLVNSDRECPGGVVVTGSWTGISDLVHHNPSEWGSLVLVRKRHPLVMTVIGTVLLLTAGILVVLRRKKRVRTYFDYSVYDRPDPVIERVREYLRQNISREDRELVPAAAEDAGMCPEYLRQYFKRTTGCSLHNYINHLRVEKAMELLQNTRKAITDIAFESGFGSLQTFNKVFKNDRNLTASEFRDRNRGYK